MATPRDLIARANLATPRRTVAGILGQMALLGVTETRARALLTQARVPASAYEHPGVPISFTQDVTMLHAMLEDLPPDRSPVGLLFTLAPQIGISLFGLLGLAMQHAATGREALTVSLAYPQLSWGRSRLVIEQQGNLVHMVYAMDPPALPGVSPAALDRLMGFAMVLDLLSTMRMIEDVMGAGWPPLRMTLPCPAPSDGAPSHGTPQSTALPCPVRFQAPRASLVYPAAMLRAPTVRANRLAFRSYKQAAQDLSLLLSDDGSMAERVTRWLWSASPILKRGDVARVLGLSERSLARRLQAEGVSYHNLFAQVQADRATTLLRDTALSISAVSERLGYSEPAAFSRAFTAWTGLSPLKWRQARRTNPAV